MVRRALWITRFDWQDERALRDLVTTAIEVGITDLIMQARGAGDALYRSRVAPASPKIAERLGADATWDPLAVVCDVARERDDVRVHAWLNALSGWTATSEEACEGLAASSGDHPDHLLVRHPEVALVDERRLPMPCPNASDYIWMSPEHPAVISELRAVVDELVSGYPLAGVHLDRIRFPEGNWRDSETGDRRASSVTSLVRNLRQCLPPDVELTASIVPDYSRVVDGEREHLATFGQDGWRWVADGVVDSVMPMVYTPIREGADDDWHRLMHEHLDGIDDGCCWIPLFAELGDEMLQEQASLAALRPNAGIAWYSAGLIERYDRWSLVRRIHDFR